MTDSKAPSIKSTKNSTVSLDYRAAGVDIDAGDELVDRIKPYTRRTRRPEVLGGLGGFGALFELPLHKYKRPVLVSGTDGVGTKLKLATTLGIHDTIGIDLVAMCVNDILTSGAEPLFFLDYYATGKLDVDVAESVIKGIALGCEQAGASLVGGETAEMPGMYHPGDYDLAGFSVGIVDFDKIIDGSCVQVGDILIGLPSSGPHSNGYSLIRKVLEVSGTDIHQACEETTLAKALLAPTRIYVKTILALLEKFQIHAMCHITGGGLLENLPRVLPQNTLAVVDLSSWKMPTVFKWLQHAGNIQLREMHRTFNCGVGFVICVKLNDADAVVKSLNEMGESAFILGSIQPSNEAEPHVIMR